MGRPSLFISYRRRDSEHAAQRIFQRLREVFGDDAVFIDRELHGGDDWQRQLRSRLDGCSAVVVVVGERFVELLERRRERGVEADPLLVEIEHALAARKAIVPVVLGAGDMPGVDALPASIRALAGFNAIFAPAPYFDTAMDRLVRDIARLHDWHVAAPPPAPSAASAAARAADAAPAAAPPPPPPPTRRAASAVAVLAAVALAGAIGGAALWALGHVVEWLAAPPRPWPAAQRAWHAAQCVAATALLGLGPALAARAVGAARAHANLPLRNRQALLTTLNVAAILVLGGVFLLLSTQAGWRLRPWLPAALFPPAPGAAHYAALALAMLLVVVGAVALAVWEPAARRERREHPDGGAAQLRRLDATGVALLAAMAWFAASLAGSLRLPPQQDIVPVVGYVMLCPTLSLTLLALGEVRARLDLRAGDAALRPLLALVGAIWAMAAVALFALGPLRLLPASAGAAAPIAADTAAAAPRR